MRMRIDESERKIGAAIRAARITADLTQAALADRANLSIGAISNLERGSANLTTLLRVTNVLGLTGAIIEAIEPASTFSPLAVAEKRRSAPPPRQRVRS